MALDYECGVCGEKFTNIGDFGFHEGLTGHITCEFCGKKFKGGTFKDNTNELISHKRETHPEKIKYECGCGEKFTNIGDFGFHEGLTGHITEKETLTNGVKNGERIQPAPTEKVAVSIEEEVPVKKIERRIIEAIENLKSQLVQRAIEYADDNLDNPNSGREFWNYIQENTKVFLEVGATTGKIYEIAQYALATHLKEKVALRELRNVRQGITETKRRLNEILESISRTQDLDEVIQLGTVAQNLINSIKQIYETKLGEITNNILR